MVRIPQGGEFREKPLLKKSPSERARIAPKEGKRLIISPIWVLCKVYLPLFGSKLLGKSYFHNFFLKP